MGGKWGNDTRVAVVLLLGFALAYVLSAPADGAAGTAPSGETVSVGALSPSPSPRVYLPLVVAGLSPRTGSPTTVPAPAGTGTATPATTPVKATATGHPTGTAYPTKASTATPTPESKSTATPSHTPTATTTPTRTPTSTATPTASTTATPSPTPLPAGAVAGQVVSAVAVTGSDTSQHQVLVGATVCVQEGGICTSSDGQGNYIITGVPPGEYTVTAEAALHYSVSEVATVVDKETTKLHFALSPVFGSAQTQNLRFVLTWGETPHDLDAHLWLPATTPYHIYWYSPGLCGYYWPHTCLNADDQTGYGPETITVGQRVSGQYTFAVNRYAGEASLAGSGAKVRVYRYGGLSDTIEVPAVGEGNWWYVCDLDGVTGALTIRNELQTESPVP